MAVHRYHLTFPKELVTEPIIYYLGKEFNVITNIRRANVDQDGGWVDLEIEGDEEEIERAVESLKRKGVGVDPIERQVIE
ncbi:MAG: hypothetical protein GDYSWBUE_001131 [Candidatus Fervidibacterota bacterium]